MIGDEPTHLHFDFAIYDPIPENRPEFLGKYLPLEVGSIMIKKVVINKTLQLEECKENKVGILLGQVAFS